MKNILLVLVLSVLLWNCEKDAVTPTTNECPNCPSITSISPLTGMPGTMVTIKGTNFDRFEEEGYVKVGNVTTIQVGTTTASEIKVEIPSDTKTGELVVCTKNVNINQNNVLCSNEVADYKSFTFTVLGEPIANFSWQELQCREVIFENLSANANVFQWDFGDGHTSIDASPTHQYDTNGIYRVSLSTSNELDETADTTLIVEVNIETFNEPLFGIVMDAIQLEDGTLITASADFGMLDIVSYNPSLDSNGSSSFDNFDNNWSVRTEITSVLTANMLESSEGHIIICGSHRDESSNNKAFFIKIDKQGNILRERKGNDVIIDYPTIIVDGIIELPNGKFIISGGAGGGPGFWAILGMDGDLLKIRNTPFDFEFWLSKPDATYGGISLIDYEHIIVAGHYKYHIININTEEVRTHSFNHSFNRHYPFTSHRVLMLKDGKFAVTGTVEINSNNKLFIGIYDLNGNEMNTEIYDGFTIGLSIDTTADGGFIVTGGSVTESLPLIKWGNNLQEEWVKSVYVNGNRDLSSEIVMQTNDGGFIALTRFFNISHIVKTDCNGNI